MNTTTDTTKLVRKLKTYEVTITDDTDSITIIQKAESKICALCEVTKTFCIDERDTVVVIKEIE